MSRFTGIKLKTLLLLSVFAVAGCSTSITVPSPPNDLMAPSGELKPIISAEDAADVIRDNGKVQMYDRDRVARWQAWWNGVKNKAP